MMINPTKAIAIVLVITEMETVRDDITINTGRHDAMTEIDLQDVTIGIALGLQSDITIVVGAVMIADDAMVMKIVTIVIGVIIVVIDDTTIARIVARQITIGIAIETIEIVVTVEVTIERTIAMTIKSATRRGIIVTNSAIPV